MALGQMHIILSIAVVFIATFSLFYIFDNLSKLADRCKAGEGLSVCSQLNGFTMSMIIILLVIGGFVIVISMVVFILLSG